MPWGQYGEYDFPEPSSPGETRSWAVTSISESVRARPGWMMPSNSRQATTSSGSAAMHAAESILCLLSFFMVGEF